MISSGSGAAMSQTKSHSPRSHDPVEDAAAEARDRVLVLADAPRREAPVDQRAAPLVVGVVHRDHHRQRRGRAAGAPAGWRTCAGSFSMASTSS